MSDQIKDFKTLPEEHQQIIRLAQDRFNIKIVPLQELVAGLSGAYVFLVSVASKHTNEVEHCILKLDRKGKFSKADEITRHNTVLNKSGSEFVRDHIAELAFDRVEYEGNFAIFYRIAGQSLLEYLPLSAYKQQSQLEALFHKTYEVMLSEWNQDMRFEQGVHPQEVLAKWLGFRLDQGQKIEKFMMNVIQVDPDNEGLLINGNVYPNPLRYARAAERWGDVRSIDVATGFLHRDLNTNNILVKFSDIEERIEGYYLIDFALFKDAMPLVYDQRYLEMSYLVGIMSQGSYPAFVDFLLQLAEVDMPSPQNVPIEMSGVGAVIASARKAFAGWVSDNHPSLHDDLWGQYWLAGVAAGLSYMHKSGQPDKQRLAGLIFAAVNLKRFVKTFSLPLPTEAAFLYNHDRSHTKSQRRPKTKQIKNNLPNQPTRFIGRESKISEIRKLLLRPDVRLVTLHGPGGTGKTRLSLKVAEDVLAHFPDGVFFVPLADDRDRHQMVSRIAKQLGIREGGRPLLESITDYLRHKALLMVLDNFEQLVDHVAIISEIITEAPEIKILVTSRIALDLYGEHRFPVPPMKLPQEENELTLEELIENESVTMFLDRARAADSGFSLTKQNASAVAEICRRLDGLPLAIELAAARVKIFKPQAILSRLDDRFDLLSNGARNIPDRHQTLRNTLSWSYDLLDKDEKILYNRLSVFKGGFTMDAAKAVCNFDHQLDILMGLTSLVDNSLIRKDETADNEPRFKMLETIREFAFERLVESGELETLQERHAKYFGDIAINQIGFELYAENALYWLDWLERELSNIRAMLNWSLSDLGDIQLGAQTITMILWFWYRRGYLTEGLNWAEKFLKTPDLQEPSLMRAFALQCAGILAVWKGEQEKGLERLKESLALLQREEEDPWIGLSYMSNAVALINMGRDSAARPLLETAGNIFKETNQDYFLAVVLVHLGNVELGLGHPKKARSVLNEALSVARPLNENWILSFVLNNLGEVARTQGQYKQAREVYEKCTELLKDTGDRGDMARFIHSLAYIDQYEGDLELAESKFRKGLEMFRRLGNRRGIAECLAGLAGVKARAGHLEWGATMLSTAKSLLESTGGAWWPADRVEVERTHELIKSSLDEDVFKSAWGHGKSMNIDQAIQFATNEK